jgi:hypothetical protein
MSDIINSDNAHCASKQVEVVKCSSHLVEW